MELFEKKISEKLLYDGRIMRVHIDTVELPDGKTATRELVDHNGGACIAALTEDYELFFVKQFRNPFDTVLTELPAGKLEKGEDPKAAAIRELEEECGLKAENVVEMGTVYPTVAYCSEIIYLYLATGLSKSVQHLDEGEFLSVEKIPLDKATEMVMRGEIADSKTALLIMKIARLKDEGKI
ncbi:MAG: NUDIX hydrolase [Ruminococcus sp.]|nr:NUDIX hydrolase [Ruminococcus sp.]